MTAFSPIDMTEVTRLTRAGRLDDAMALLQGRPAAPRTQAPQGAGPGATHPPILDMTAPTLAGEAWTAPGTETAGSAAASPRRAGAPTAQGLSEALRARFPGLDALAALGAGPGAARAVPVPAGARFEVRSIASAAGERTYKVYVPGGRTGEGLPLVVMLHGCTQSPDDFAAGTRMNALAEAQGFLVAYPAQARSANAQGCWNWFNAAEQRREGGEPALIAGIAQAVIREFAADPTRVYVAGLSAGGAMAAILGETHPDLFAAVGVHSGLPCGAAKDMPSAFAAMKSGGPVHHPGGTHARVPTIVFHGDADRTVSAVNGDRIVAQATPPAMPIASGAAITRGQSEGGVPYTRSVRSDASGRAVLEQWVLHGAGHAWAGGSPEGSYTDPHGPDASHEMVRFFLAHATAPARN